MRVEELDLQDFEWLLKDKYGWSVSAVAGATSSIHQDYELFLKDTSSELRQDIELLQQGVPVAYVIGWVRFLGCHIDLRYRTLIPRPETEFWVEQFLKKQSEKQGQNLRVLDLCCGSGCISAAVLQHLPTVEVMAVDVDPKAIEQTTLNLAPFKNWSVKQSDLFAEVDGQLDFILSNPPYVSSSEEVQQSTQFEPHYAIFAQNKGFALIDKIILNLNNYLKKDGELWLEFGTAQADHVQEMCKENNFNAEIHNDQFGRERFAVIRHTQ